MRNIKQLTDNISIYHFDKKTVLLKHLNNTPAGAPRYKAVIISGYSNYIYTFIGSYCGDEQEAKNILEYHFKKYNLQEVQQ